MASVAGKDPDGTPPLACLHFAALLKPAPLEAAAAASAEASLLTICMMSPHGGSVVSVLRIAACILCGTFITHAAPTAMTTDAAEERQRVDVVASSHMLASKIDTPKGC